MPNNVLMPQIMEIGGGAIDRLADVLSALAATRPLIITDPTMVKLGYVERAETLLQEAGIDYGIFADTVPEPTEVSIMAGVDAMQKGTANGPYDSLIALGGGSPIDSAKAIGVLGHFGGVIRDYKFPAQAGQVGLPLIAIPTTAGTGSEATRFTIITDDETVDEKMLCVGIGFTPRAAIIDYELTLSVPARVTADTGIDALTHAMEAYVSQKANAFSDQHALSAMRLIGPNLRTVYHQPGNRQARESMMLGSTLAGLAFSSASVALVHGMSRPIGAFFHVPHGMSNAMLLPAVTEFSIQSAKARYAACARAIGVAEVADSDDQATRHLLTELQSLNRELEVPSPRDFGIDKDRYFEVIATMADQALASGSPGNNPRVPDKAELIQLYEQIWS
ncbi:MAG: iron-containing alcohol dehydrogenase [Salinisphaera sp.]|jgi:alcohol dehydrogenase class IV|nr:iron-containing alcohol dehydrogenase [Salinisphaera sp.]